MIKVSCRISASRPTKQFSLQIASSSSAGPVKHLNLSSLRVIRVRFDFLSLVYLFFLSQGLTIRTVAGDNLHGTDSNERSKPSDTIPEYSFAVESNPFS
jgi:hypothetical protein